MERKLDGLGTLRGVETDATAVFRGVPYAEPATGKLRFAPPAPKRPWDGVLDATQNRSVSPQVKSRTFWAMGDGGGVGSIGEDCLNLTIWAPSGAENLPVLFWIHGGAFTTGAGSWAWYDGGRLAAEQNIVVVNCNYRLGAFGYLFCGDRVPRNLGLQDQVEALRWVNRHIAAFGGDPAKVTIGGQSAGAHSVVSLLQLPETEGLFARALIESFPDGIPVRTDDVAARWSDTCLEILGLSPGQADLVDRLQALPMNDILQAQVQTTKALPPPVGDINPPFAPVQTPDMPAGDAFLRAAAAGAAKRGTPVMIGWTRDESVLFTLADKEVQAMTEEGVRAYAQRQFGEAADDRIAQARRRRPGAGRTELFNMLMTDAVFRDGTLALVEGMAQGRATVFVYRFDWRPPSPLQACHCSDMPFVFGNLASWKGSAMMGDARDADLEPLVQDMQRRVGAFVKGGDPGVRAWAVGDRELLHIDDEAHVQKVDDLALI